MFLGTHTPRLDDKGRLFLPAKFRERLAGGLVVTRGQERCLLRLPDGRVRHAWRPRCSPRRSRARPSATTAGCFLSGASDEIPDKQGRITIPAALRALRRPDRDCTSSGRLAHRDLGRRRVGALPRRAASSAFSEQPRRSSPACSTAARRTHPAAPQPGPAARVPSGFRRPGRIRGADRPRPQRPGPAGTDRTSTTAPNTRGGTDPPARPTRTARTHATDRTSAMTSPRTAADRPRPGPAATASWSCSPPP